MSIRYLQEIPRHHSNTAINGYHNSFITVMAHYSRLKSHYSEGPLFWKFGLGLLIWLAT